MDPNEPPGHLTDASKQRWRDITAENAIDAAAIPVLTSYLTALDRVEQARAEIARIGPLIKDRFDIVKANPWVAIERDSTLIMHRAFRLLGFDQEARGAQDQGKLFG
jgi:phage terminase small subunit